jgi:hypothetical protein
VDAERTRQLILGCRTAPPRGAADAASIKLDEKHDDKKSLATGLGNVAHHQLVIGERSIEIFREIKEELDEGRGRTGHGQVLAYRSQFAEAEQEWNIGFDLFKKQDNPQGQGVISAYRALRALLMGDASAALSAACKAREFAEEYARTQYPHERDFIRAEWLIGAALTLTLALSRRQNTPTGEGTFAEAERHL